MPDPSFPERRFAGLPIHARVASAAVELLARDDRVIGLYLSGSFAKGRPDSYSDIDLYVLVGEGTIDRVIEDHRKDLIPRVADVAAMFPATHLGDEHQIIVFYRIEFPIHVDYQYREPSELVPSYRDREVEILLDRTGELDRWLERCRQANPDEGADKVGRVQYLEDRFWGWCWYTHSKVERGELWEARDALEYIRTNVLVDLASIGLGLPEEGNRRLEQKLPEDLLHQLEATIPASHIQDRYRAALRATIDVYERLFEGLPGKLVDRVEIGDRAYFRRSLDSP